MPTPAHPYLAGTRTGWGRVGGLAQLRDMTDTRCLILSLTREDQA